MRWEKNSSHTALHLGREDIDIPKYIIISGKKGHGKDLLASALIYQLSKAAYCRFFIGIDAKHNNRSYVSIRGPQTKKFRFADPIKMFAKHAFAFTEDQLNGATKEIVDPEWNKTPREIMQLIGSGMRDLIDVDLYAKSLVARAQAWGDRGFYSDYKVALVTDCRYPNEVNIAMQSLPGCRVIRILRPNMPATPFDQHESETALDNFNGWHHVVLNDGTKKDLNLQSRKLVWEWLKIDKWIAGRPGKYDKP